MSIAISSRSAAYAAYFRPQPGPQAIPKPGADSATEPASRVKASSAVAAISNVATFGATIATGKAQDSPGAAQQGANGQPGRDPGLQDGEAIFGDVNGDRELNGDDIAALLKAFNTSVAEADLNADGNVNTADLGALISAIRDLNNASKPNVAPAGGSVRGQDPLVTVDLPSGKERITEVQASSITPGNPFIKEPGEQDPPVAQPGVFGDLTGDGIVNADDMAILRESFGKSGASNHTTGDLNGDGLVDTADLGTMMGILRRQAQS